MEKYIRVSDINKDHAPVYTAEEIADNYRGAEGWEWDGSKYVCKKCRCKTADYGRFCKFCGSHNG